MNHNPAHVPDLEVFALMKSVSESIAANHCTGMNATVLTHFGEGINGDVGINCAVIPNLNMREDNHSRHDFYTLANLDMLTDENILSNVSRPVSYTHLRAHETDSYLVCRLLLEKK